MVGTWFTVIVTLELEGVHGEFEIVHAKTFVPDPKPVIAVAGESGLAIVPLPEINVHTPVPTVAVLAAITVFGPELHRD